jgi:hypothetical protein
MNNQVAGGRKERLYVRFKAAVSYLFFYFQRTHKANAPSEIINNMMLNLIGLPVQTYDKGILHKNFCHRWPDFFNTVYEKFFANMSSNLRLFTGNFLYNTGYTGDYQEIYITIYKQQTTSRA